MFSFFKKSDPNMWMLVGLGNPGDKYKNNRHNIGFHVIDQIAENENVNSFSSKFQAHIAQLRVGNEKALLVKPQTYMNESGISVGKAAKFYKIEPQRIIVFHDELDIEPGKVRVKTGGGNAGHNGLKSIQAHLGTPDFIRVRLGIGHPGDKNRVSAYVLSDFSKAEQPTFERLTEAVADETNLLLSGNADDFMTRTNEKIKG